MFPLRPACPVLAMCLFRRGKLIHLPSTEDVEPILGFNNPKFCRQWEDQLHS